MTEATENKQQAEAPIFNVVGQFAKDVSLECPLPPFAKGSEKIDMQMDVGVSVRALEDDHNEVVLKLKAEAKNDEGDVCYLAEVHYAGVFTVKNVPEDQLTALLSVDGAALVYPFARQTLMAMVNEAGYRAPVLGPINFHALFLQAQQQRETEAKES